MDNSVFTLNTKVKTHGITVYSHGIQRISVCLSAPLCVLLTQRLIIIGVATAGSPFGPCVFFTIFTEVQRTGARLSFSPSATPSTM
ncbi:hypothetical protein OUZ56_033428 [Daphnia magna]|uniref:Uncharacterized protein n=1 Tax=Daphnia magna TaxID=35525 RepID=A0ABQ9ZXU7_9CRUS|nr:hypothetical protein OUZ56_033428 [Daphnia magna]